MLSRKDVGILVWFLILEEHFQSFSIEYDVSYYILFLY